MCLGWQNCEVEIVSAWTHSELLAATRTVYSLGRAYDARFARARTTTATSRPYLMNHFETDRASELQRSFSFTFSSNNASVRVSASSTKSCRARTGTESSEILARPRQRERPPPPHRQGTLSMSEAKRRRQHVHRKVLSPFFSPPPPPPPLSLSLSLSLSLFTANRVLESVMTSLLCLNKYLSREIWIRRPESIPKDRV